jgi:hypothetical protein
VADVIETRINYSEFNTLTDCEQRWVYAFLDKEEEQGARKGLRLGTLIHLWHGRWLMGQGATLPPSWTDDINTGGKPGEERTLCLTDFDPELVARAQWLAQRFEAHYGSRPPSSWNVISAEDWMSREFEWGTLVGRTDGFVEIDGRLWLIEVKSYGSRPGPLAYAVVSPQLGCYSLLAETHFGQRPWGILYQGIYTYQWVPNKPTQKSVIEAWQAAGRTEPLKDLKLAAKVFVENPANWTERDPSESFEQLEVDFGDAQLRTAERYLNAAVNRRDVLTALPAEALPSVGQHCKGCGFKDRCWSELGGVEPFEIEIDDEDAEPV